METTKTIDSWRRIWREGLAPLFSQRDLEILHAALEADDPRLLQGATVMPPPLPCIEDWPVEGADLIAFVAWQAHGLETLGQCEDFFARVCSEVDRRLGEPAAIRWFLNYWDEAPREEAFRETLCEVRAALVQRRVSASQAGPGSQGGSAVA